MQRCEVAVAGAGPGGLAAALALHRLGNKVVIFEQFSAARPLGSGLILQPTGLAVLDWLGLGQNIRDLGARIDRLSGVASRTGKTVLDVRYAALGEMRGYAVHRAALFGVLHDAVRAAGIPIETDRQVRALEDGKLVFVAGRHSARFDLVVDALGARSPLKRLTLRPPKEWPLDYGAIWGTLPWPETGFDPHALEQRYDRAAVMIGVLPIGRLVEKGPQLAAFFWSLKANAHAEWHARGLNVWKQEVLNHWPETEPLLAQITSPDQMTLARYQHHTLAKPYGVRLISIGDSAHSTSPQLGQGCNNALLDVMALALEMETANTLEDACQNFTWQRQRHVRTYQALSYFFTPFYQSDSQVLPWLRDTLVSQAAKVPVLQRLLARMVAGTVVAPLRGLPIIESWPLPMPTPVDG